MKRPATRHQPPSALRVACRKSTRAYLHRVDGAFEAHECSQGYDGQCCHRRGELERQEVFDVVENGLNIHIRKEERQSELKQLKKYVSTSSVLTRGE